MPRQILISAARKAKRHSCLAAWERSKRLASSVSSLRRKQLLRLVLTTLFPVARNLVTVAKAGVINSILGQLKVRVQVQVFRVQPLGCCLRKRKLKLEL